jgi:hypothetical protein
VRSAYKTSVVKKKKAGNHLENVDIDICVTITLKAVDQLTFFQVELYSVD